MNSNVNTTPVNNQSIIKQETLNKADKNAELI